MELRGFARPALAFLVCCLSSSAASAQDEMASPLVEPVWSRDWGFEAKAHYRDSDEFRFPVKVPTGPGPNAGTMAAILGTVDEGTHVEFSILTLLASATRGEAFEAHLKVDVVDLHDRNPTSEDHQVDIDEAWIRLGRAWEPAILPEKPGAYLKVGKMAKFERQNDRHLESYGLVSTAFNRFEDLGFEAGLDLGRHVYLRGSFTQGNPLFIRDPNALAGDNGTSRLFNDPPNPELGTGVVILYDAEVEGIDSNWESGLGLGVRFADESGARGVEFLAFGYQRDLAETVDLGGTFYGGDLDLLRGPFNEAPLAIQGRQKEEVGANLWLYLDGFSFFAQYVDQEAAGLKRTGYELEAAWRIDLPLAWAVGGRQLFPSISPAVRFSKLNPEFGGAPGFPAPSITWDWEKIDYGVRLGILPQLDLTAEYAANDFVLATGALRQNDELLLTVRWLSQSF